MGRKNIIAGIVLILIGIGYGYLASELPIRDVKGVPGPSFFPIIITLALIALSSAMFFQGLKQIRAGDAGEEISLPPKKVMIMLFVFLAFIAALPYLGFLYASIPFLTVMILLYGGRHKLLLIIAGPGIPLILYYFFRHVFLIPLPQATLSILGG